MFPFLVKYQSFSIPTFSFMLMVASLLATFYVYFRAPKKGLSQTVVLDLGIIGTIAGIVGSRIFHVLVEEPRYYWEDFRRIYQVWNGGFVSYGAVILIGISWFVYLRARKLPVYKYLDLTALICPLIVMAVRIGCLGAGCCYGKPTDFPIHLTFTTGDAARHYFNVPLHATQIYDFLNGLLIFVILHLVDARKKFEGQLIWLFLILYGFNRGLIEFLRGDVDRGVYLNGMISTAQIMGILGILFGLAMYFHCKKRYPLYPSTRS